jgi:AcrR family transcriptional regulator
MTDTSRQRILDAFAQSLLHQPYDTLSVSALLRRAGVGRTSFYAQFRDKEELFALSVGQMGQFISRAALAEPGPWGFLLPFFLHVDSHRAIYNGFVGRESLAVLERQLHRLFARWLRDDLAGRGRAAPDVVREAAMVGALWALMVGWMERRVALSPHELATQAAQFLDALAPR